MLKVSSQLGGQHLEYSWAVHAVTEKLIDRLPQGGTVVQRKEHWTGSLECWFLKTCFATKSV